MTIRLSVLSLGFVSGKVPYIVNERSSSFGRSNTRFERIQVLECCYIRKLSGPWSFTLEIPSSHHLQIDSSSGYRLLVREVILRSHSFVLLICDSISPNFFGNNSRRLTRSVQYHMLSHSDSRGLFITHYGRLIRGSYKASKLGRLVLSLTNQKPDS